MSLLLQVRMVRQRLRTCWRIYLLRLFKTYKTQGNYNNEIGLPYTVLHMPDDTEKLVLEMGQDHLGDIHLLSELARPKIAIVTLVGEAHFGLLQGSF